jgi:hypothetical protein
MLIGKLPKMNFPKFEGENPKLWKSCCESYFEMYDIDTSIWVKVASMHFDGPAARWLQSMEHRVCTTNWSELCSWIHDRFGQDQLSCGLDNCVKSSKLTQCKSTYTCFVN